MEVARRHMQQNKQMQAHRPLLEAGDNREKEEAQHRHDGEETTRRQRGEREVPVMVVGGWKVESPGLL